MVETHPSRLERSPWMKESEFIKRGVSMEQQILTRKILVKLDYWLELLEKQPTPEEIGFKFEGMFLEIKPMLEEYFDSDA